MDKKLIEDINNINLTYRKEQDKIENIITKMRDENSQNAENKVDKILINNSNVIKEIETTYINNLKYLEYYSKEHLIANDINNIIKFFYKKQTKTHLGQLHYTGRYIQISKKGIGYAWNQNGNITTLGSLFDGDYSFWGFFNNEILFNDIKEVMTDEGKICLEKIKKILINNKMDCYKNIEINIPQEKLNEISNITKDSFNTKFFGYYYQELHEQDKLYLTGNGVSIGRNKGYQTRDIFNYYNQKISWDRKESKIIAIFYKDEIISLINENIEYIKTHKQHMENINEELKKIAGKYILLNKI